MEAPAPAGATTQPPLSRTLPVKVGNQTFQSMTPDQAADYLKAMANSRGGSGGVLESIRRQVHHMTAGSGLSRSAFCTSTQASAAGTEEGPSLTLAAPGFSSPLSGEAVVHHSPHLNSGIPLGTPAIKGTRPDGMPCSEKEMKALMSMFVEIMGLQMDTDRLNSLSPHPPHREHPQKNVGPPAPEAASTTATSGYTSSLVGSKGSHKNTATTKLFHFPENIPPPPGGWPPGLLWPSNVGGAMSDRPDYDASDDDLDNEVDSVPDLEDIPVDEKGEAGFPMLVSLASLEHHQGVDGDLSEVVTGVEGIVPLEWDALERVAVEEALEQEERTRKSNPSNSRKNKEKAMSRKQLPQAIKEVTLKQMEALRQVEALEKKREKAIQSWRSCVVSACQANEMDALEQLLSGSPFQKTDKVSFFLPHLEHLVASCVPKNRHQIGRETALALAVYLLDLYPDIMLAPLRTGRSPLHTASFFADLDLLRFIVDRCPNHQQPLPPPDLVRGEHPFSRFNETCQDSGWTPLHYAALSGSLPAVEILLGSGCDPKLVSSDAHTWYTETGKGLTPRELIDAILCDSYDRDIETHGMAFADMVKHFVEKASERPQYLAHLEIISQRLKEVEQKGYHPLDERQISDREKSVQMLLSKQESSLSHPELTSSSPSVSVDGNATPSDSSHPKGKKRKKKNKSAQQAQDAVLSTEDKQTLDGSQANSSSANSVNMSGGSKSSREDPVVVALRGMGFSDEQIQGGVAACGGIDRATVDNVVSYIFGQDSIADTSLPHNPTDAVSQKGEVDRQKEKTFQSRQSNQAPAQRRQNEHVMTDKAAAKREEQRRRNREWNQAQARQQPSLRKVESKPDTDAIRSIGNAPITSNMLPPALNKSTVHSTMGSVLSTASTTARAPLQKKFSPRGDAIESMYSNETSTIASSIDQLSVEIGGNDDATVSTLGSFAARATPTLASFSDSPPVPPPGFGPALKTLDSAWESGDVTWSNAPSIRPIGPVRAPVHAFASGLSFESTPLLGQQVASASALAPYGGGATIRHEFNPIDSLRHIEITEEEASGELRSSFSIPAGNLFTPVPPVGSNPIVNGTSESGTMLKGLDTPPFGSEAMLIEPSDFGTSLISSISTDPGEPLLVGSSLWGRRTLDDPSILGSLLEASDSLRVLGDSNTQQSSLLTSIATDSQDESKRPWQPQLTGLRGSLTGGSIW